MKLKILFCLLLSGCTSSSPWHFDSIATGEPSFDSSRLVYQTRDSLLEANLEFFYREGKVSAYVTSPARRFERQAGAATTKARLTVGSEALEEELPLHAGQMRVKLPDTWAQKAIDALKDGREIAIMVGVIDQTIQPEEFSELFKKLQGPVL